MRSFSVNKSRPKKTLFLAVGVFILSGMAALAKADWSDTTLPRIESELREQSRQLSLIDDTWARAVRGRVDFALQKLQSARAVSSPAIENTHIEHACQAIYDERILLIRTTMWHELLLIEKLIEQTFEHREALGCRD